jgi:protoporphyrin/coproporphyrin ferrochelatase
MRYLGRPDFRHGSAERCGVLLVNLGTPEAPDTRSVRRYLAEFLADPRVIELPRALWLPILYGAILPFRAPRSAHAYRTIWTAEGSPLRVASEQLATALGQRLAADGRPIEVRLAMRYGQPSVASVLDDWIRHGLRRLLVLPLYPQYSATTTASVFDAVSSALGRWRWPPELRLINDYFDDGSWIDAVAGSIRRHWAQHGRGDRLLFSFHGLPQRYLLAGDPYFCQCQASARRIAAALELADADWQLSFQSRVGREEWLRPYTDGTVVALAGEGVRTLDVVCPGFAADCLETLEEIALQNGAAFRAAGGSALRYIPALNAQPAHVDALAGLIQRHGQGWAEFDPDWSTAAQAERLAQQSEQRSAYRGPLA